MRKPGAQFLDFLLGFAVGVFFSSAAVAILSELKFMIEQGKIKSLDDALLAVDESLSGEIIHPIGGAILEEVAGRVRAEEEAVKERRLFRQSTETNVFAGDSSSAIYYEEE